MPNARTSTGLWWLASGVTAVVMVLIGYVYLAAGRSSAGGPDR